MRFFILITLLGTTLSATLPRDGEPCTLSVSNENYASSGQSFNKRIAIGIDAPECQPCLTPFQLEIPTQFGCDGDNFLTFPPSDDPNNNPPPTDDPIDPVGPPTDDPDNNEPPIFAASYVSPCNEDVVFEFQDAPTDGPTNFAPPGGFPTIQILPPNGDPTIIVPPTVAGLSIVGPEPCVEYETLQFPGAPTGDPTNLTPPSGVPSVQILPPNGTPTVIAPPTVAGLSVVEPEPCITPTVIKPCTGFGDIRLNRFYNPCVSFRSSARASARVGGCGPIVLP